MAVQVPKGVVRLPWSLSEVSTGVTLTANVANVESEIIAWQCPKKMAVAVRQGDRFALYLRTAVPADIVAGIIRMYLADPNRATRFKVDEGPIKKFMAGSSGGTFNIDDREKRYLMPAGFSRETDEYLIITFTGADVAAVAQTKLLLEGVQYLQV